MSEDYEKQADAAEREVADMQEHGARVEEHIEEARKEWEAKVADPSVPGAGGDPDWAEEGGRHLETAYPAKGGEAEDGDELPPPDPHETD